jgi:TolB protein
VVDGNQEVCVTTLDGSSVERITENKRNEARPSFSPDGSEIYFCANEGGYFAVYKMKADGTDEQRISFVTGPHPAEIDPSQ